MSEKKIEHCSSCGEPHEVEVWSRINVGENPGLKASVKDGSLFVWECPHCGTRNLVQSQTLYHDPGMRLMIWRPGADLQESQIKALEAQLEKASDALEGYVLRQVDDIGTLIEKVNIADAGLDDCVIEMCKYVTKMELTEKGGSKTILDAPFKFFQVEGADNDLVFTYPSDGQLQGVKVGFNVYEDCTGIIRRNPSIKPSSGFARVDSSFISKYFG